MIIQKSIFNPMTWVRWLSRIRAWLRLRTRRYPCQSKRMHPWRKKKPCVRTNGCIRGERKHFEVTKKIPPFAPRPDFYSAKSHQNRDKCSCHTRIVTHVLVILKSWCQHMFLLLRSKKAKCVTIFVTILARIANMCHKCWHVSNDTPVVSNDTPFRQCKGGCVIGDSRHRS